MLTIYVLQLWKKLLEPTLKLQLDAAHPSAAAMTTVRMLRTRIAAICGATSALQTCLQKSCEGLKAKLKSGPMCAALQKLLAGVSTCPSPEYTCAAVRAEA